MSAIATILGVLYVLPDLIKLSVQFMTWLNSVSGNDPKGYVLKLSTAFQQLNEAESSDERKAAAKAIADAIAGL